MSDVYVDERGQVVLDVMAAGKVKAVLYNMVGKRLLKNEAGESQFWGIK
jgi:hypothetical protein